MTVERKSKADSSKNTEFKGDNNASEFEEDPASEFESPPADSEFESSEFEGAADDADPSEFDGDGSVELPKLNDVSPDNIDDLFSLVNIGSKVRIMYWGKSPVSRHVRVPEFWTANEFKLALANKRIAVRTPNGETRMKLAERWLARKDRYTYDGLIFDDKAEEVSEQDEINLWRGFGVPERKADWSLMREHIQNIIANEEKASEKYIMRWLAWAVQNPTSHSGVAMVLISKEHGTGKGTLGHAMRQIFGNHGLHLVNRKHLIGNFNAHFMQVGFLFCDEVLWPGNKADEGILKGLISEPTLSIEPKGLNLFQMPNSLKVLLASNQDWVIPAVDDERRYAAFKVNPSKKQNKDYFEGIHRQLYREGGISGMLHDLRKLDLDGWQPHHDIPQTSALAGQKMESADAELKWLAGFLNDGILPYQHPTMPNRSSAQELYDTARRVKGLGYWTDYDVMRFLDEWGIGIKRSNGSWRAFPPLLELRAEWKRRMPWWDDFNEKVTSWSASGE